jgi:hypothetical protein
VECGAVVSATGVGVDSGACLGERTVSLLDIVRTPFEKKSDFRWFCEPAYDKLRGTEEGTVNR